MNVNLSSPSRELYNQVRAGFIFQGSSLSAWCRSNDIKQPNAMHCLMGTWNGPKGQALREQLIQASGISSFPELQNAI
tara:strand:- start:12297 stop:12530 length:234 start_codon:yes stop_codon:yes gene_type:complete